jgi:hypothetical protein
MKKYLFFLAFIISAKAFSQVNFQWVKDLGGSNNDGGNSVTTDAFGNIYVTGYFLGTVDFDPGPSTATLSNFSASDVFIAKYDPAGNYLWACNTGASNGARGTGIKTDASGNVYAAGAFRGTADFDPGPGTFTLTSGMYDVFVWKLNSSGGLIWARQIGGINDDDATGLVLDPPSNTIYLTGSYYGSSDFDPGPGTYTLSSNSGSYDCYVCKLDNLGNFVWAKSLGGPNTDVGRSITVNALGEVITTGEFLSGADFDPGPSSYTLAAGVYDIFISKLDASGNFVWAKSMGGPDNDYGYSIVTDPSGNIYTTGTFKGSADFDPGTGTYSLFTSGSFLDADIFVSKLDVSGNFIWAKQMGGPTNSDIGNSIALDATGNVYTTGRYLYTCDFDPGPASYTLTSLGSAACAFVSILDASGNFVWAGGWGASMDAWGQSIAVNAIGDIYTTGVYRGTTDFDPGPSTYTLSYQGNFDAFVHKLGQSAAGIKSIPKEPFISIYPNPGNGIFKIKLAPEISNPEIIVYNSIGEKVFRQTIKMNNDVLDIPGLNEGFYTYVITSDSREPFSGKLIVEY